MTTPEEQGQTGSESFEAAAMLKGLEVKRDDSGAVIETSPNAPSTPETSTGSKLNFNTGDIVSVNRSDGSREHDWKIEGVDEQDMIVAVSPDGKSERKYSSDRLSAIQFAPGDEVKHYSNKAGNEGWQVMNQLPDGQILLIRGGEIRPSGEDELAFRSKVSLSELFAEQQPGYMPPVEEFSEPAADTAPKESRITRARRVLGNRIAGN